MFRTIATRLSRVLLPCLLAATACLAMGTARAQTPVTCASTAPDQQVHPPSRILNNRETPYGRLVDSGLVIELPAAAHLNCRQGRAGDEIEFEVRFVGGTARPDPYNGLVMLDSTVPGVGIQVEVNVSKNNGAPTPLLDPNGTQFVMVRGPAPVDGIFVSVRAYAAKIGDIDLTRDHKVHDQPLVQVNWRLKGEGAWNHGISFRWFDIGNTTNMLAETCFFSDTPTLPLTRSHTLRTVSSGEFTGVGSEAHAYVGADTYLMMECRNFLGGSLVVDSPSRHPTWKGVLNNGAVGPDAATGIGLLVRTSSTESGQPWDFHVPWRIPPVPSFSLTPIDYYVRYVQTEPVMTPGTFRATVTLTIEYN